MKHSSPKTGKKKRSKKMNYRNEWLSACFSSSSAAAPIIAVFKNGREERYTMRIFQDLKTDPAISYIYDAETGELLHSND